MQGTRTEGLPRKKDIRTYWRLALLDFYIRLCIGRPVAAAHRPQPVPAVRSADLKSAWEFQNKILAAYAGQQMIIDIRGVCSPGADVAAVGFRVSMLWMLKKIQEFPGNPPDVLFDALAIVPMIGMAPGVPQQGLPFDLDELLKLVQK